MAREGMIDRQEARRRLATEDIAGIAAGVGVLTGAGRRTSHAAVVARELAQPCLVGCAGFEVDLEVRSVRIGDAVLSERSTLSLDAGAGRVLSDAPALVEERPEAELAELAAWKTDHEREEATMEATQELTEPLAGMREQIALERLVERFEGVLDRESIERIVDETLTALTARASIQSFVPILAERIVRDRLRALERAHEADAIVCGRA